MSKKRGCLKTLLIGILLLGLLAAIAYGSFIFGGRDASKPKDDMTVTQPGDTTGTDDSGEMTDSDRVETTDPDDSEDTLPEGMVRITFEGETYVVPNAATWQQLADNYIDVEPMYDGIMTYQDGDMFLMRGQEYVRATDFVVSGANYEAVSRVSMTVLCQQPDAGDSPLTRSFYHGLTWGDILCEAYDGDQIVDTSGLEYLTIDDDRNIVYDAAEGEGYYLQYNNKVVTADDLLIANVEYTWSSSLMYKFVVNVSGMDIVAYSGETLMALAERTQSFSVYTCCERYYVVSAGLMFYRNGELYEGEALQPSDVICEDVLQVSLTYIVDDTEHTYSYSDCVDAHWWRHIENKEIPEFLTADGYVVYSDGRYLLLDGNKVLATDHLLAGKTYTVASLASN